MKILIFFSILIVSSFHLNAQVDPEFPKEFIMHLKLHNGMSTNFKSTAPDLYIGGLQLVPQYTIIAKHLRVGIIVDGFYTGKKIQGAFGPTVSLKLKTLAAKPFGSAGNINLSLDHLWGTEKQHLFGGAINADIGNIIVLGISLHRDYNLNNWWLQQSVGFRISKVKKIQEEFN